MLKFIRFVPPWVWMFGASITATVFVGAFAWTYQKGITNAMNSVKEQIWDRQVWIQETNLKFEKEQIKIDNSFKGKMQANDQEWK
jgi:uncharacterized protein (DUF697 family)